MSQKSPKTYRGVVYHYDDDLDFKIYKMNHLTDLHIVKMLYSCKGVNKYTSRRPQVHNAYKKMPPACPFTHDAFTCKRVLQRWVSRKSPEEDIGHQIGLRSQLKYGLV